MMTCPFSTQPVWLGASTCSGWFYLLYPLLQEGFISGVVKTC
jgi:hypothetical protein